MMKSPNFSRYERVAHIMLADTAIRSKLSGKTQAICRPPFNTSKEFPIEVIQVTDTIHRSGEDAQSKSRNDILTLAGRIVVTKEVKPSALFPFEQEKPAPEPKAEKPKPAAKPKPESKPEPKAAKPKRTKAEPLPEPDVPAPVPTAATVKVGEPSQQELDGHTLVRWVPVSSPPLAAARSGLPAPVGVSASTLLIHAAHLLETHGGDAMKPVVGKLDELIVFIQKNTSLPANYAETPKVEQQPASR
jgi:hypothetical protein